ncbi:MAG: hypothetical protein ABIP54_02020 [Candidatus Andersenbacteria bacterium]
MHASARYSKEIGTIKRKGQQKQFDETILINVTTKMKDSLKVVCKKLGLNHSEFIRLVVEQKIKQVIGG